MRKFALAAIVRLFTGERSREVADMPRAAAIRNAVSRADTQRFHLSYIEIRVIYIHISFIPFESALTARAVSTWACIEGGGERGGGTCEV